MTNKQIKGLLFDFNGTLFFDSKLHIEAFKKYFTTHGKEEPTDEFIAKNIFGRPNPRIYTENFNPNPTDAECKAFANEKEGLYRELCLKQPELMKYTDGVCEMLDWLKENSVPFCLATGSEIDNVSFYIEHMGLGRWFDLDNIVYFDGTFQGKPEPDAYLLAAKRIGLDASECAVFEDGTSGIIAAHRAGAGAVIAVHEPGIPSPITDEVTCDAVYHDFTHWKEIFKNLGIMR